MPRRFHIGFQPPARQVSPPSAVSEKVVGTPYKPVRIVYTPYYSVQIRGDFVILLTISK
jgi:hypothetical protein